MRLVGTIDKVQQIEKIITSYKRCYCMKKDSVPIHFILNGFSGAGEPIDTVRAHFVNQYEVFTTDYCSFIITFEYDTRESQAVIRFSEQNIGKFFASNLEIETLISQLNFELKDESGRYGNAIIVKQIDDIMKARGTPVFSQTYKSYHHNRYTLLYGNLLFVVTLKYSLDKDFGWFRITERNIETLYNAIPNLYNLISQLKDDRVKELTTELKLAVKEV